MEGACRQTLQICTISSLVIAKYRDLSVSRGSIGTFSTESRDLKIRRRRVSTTADLVEKGWGGVAVAMAGKYP